MKKVIMSYSVSKATATRPVKLELSISLSRSEVAKLKDILNFAVGKAVLTELRLLLKSSYGLAKSQADLQKVSVARLCYRMAYPKAGVCSCGELCHFINSKLGYRTSCSRRCASKDPQKNKKSAFSFGKSKYNHPKALLKLKKYTCSFSSNNGKIVLRELLERSPRVYEYVLSVSETLGIPTSQVLYHMRSKTHEIPKCLCGVHTRFKTLSRGYSTYCPSCAGSSSEVKAKILKVHTEKYGCPAASAKVTRDKIDATNLKRYGTIHPMKNRAIAFKSFRSGTTFKTLYYLGKRFEYMGYEAYAIKYLVEVKKLNVGKLRSGFDVKSFQYGNRTYYPDLQYGKCIFEIKSTYTAARSLPAWEQIVRKANAVISAGYKYRLAIFSDIGKILYTTTHPKLSQFSSIENLHKRSKNVSNPLLKPYKDLHK